MILQVPFSNGKPGLSTVTVDYQDLNPAANTIQNRIQALSDWTNRKPPPVVQSDMPTITNLGTES